MMGYIFGLVVRRMTSYLPLQASGSRTTRPSRTVANGSGCKDLENADTRKTRVIRIKKDFVASCAGMLLMFSYTSIAQSQLNSATVSPSANEAGVTWLKCEIHNYYSTNEKPDPHESRFTWILVWQASAQLLSMYVANEQLISYMGEGYRVTPEVIVIQEQKEPLNSTVETLNRISLLYHKEVYSHSFNGINWSRDASEGACKTINPQRVRKLAKKPVI
jgi:hypothetical protein